MDEKQIGIKIKTSLSGTSEARLTKYAENLSKIQAFSKGIDKGALKQIDNSAKALSNNEKQLKNIEKTSKTAFAIGGITAFLGVAKKLVTTLGKFSSKSAEYTENLNLYQVAFEGATEEADKFVNKLTEMYGLDESWLVRTTGLFKQLSNAMGLGLEDGTKLSTLMTQMAIDISSLYNIDVDRASSVLQSSLAGQTKPIRGATGGDITQPTLQMTLDNLGIEKAVTNLSFAEKRLLIIISLTEQLNQATNDFGKTIESPANQTRILSQQWERFTRALGNLFLPILAKILPYLNAILMVLTEIINLVAGLLGFKIEDFDYGVSGLSDSFLEMEESMNGASESAKKLKSGLRGFDKLNVISTPSAGGSGSGAGAGGIDPEIMEAFNKAYKKYNDMLEDVRMKANDIRDSMLEWLGFTDGTYTNLKLIGGILAIITGYKIIKTISKVVKLLGGTGLFKALTKLLKPIKQLGFKGGLAKIFTTAKSSILKFLPVFGKLAIVIVIITAIVSVFVKAYKTSEKFRNKVKTMVENVTELFKTLSDKVGGAFKKIWEIFEPKWKIYKKVGKLILGWLESDITRGLANFVDVVSGTAEIITKLINGDFKGAFDALKNMIKNLRDNWKDHINEMSDKIRNFISDFDKDIIPKFKEKLEDLVEKIKDLPEKFGYWIGQAVGKIIKKIEETDWEAEGKKIVDKIVANIKLTEARAKEIINNIKSKLSKIITSTDWKSLGKDILLGIVKGLVWTTSIKNEIAKGFIKGLKDALKIHSPSRLVIENKIGDNVFYGITEGLDNSMSGLKQTANQMVDTLKTEINKSSSKVEPMFYNPNIIVDNNNGTINENKNSSPINSSSFNPTFIIQVGSKEVARTVLTDLQDMAKSNGKPITIQG